jgi:BNR repeat-containing family member
MQLMTASARLVLWLILATLTVGNPIAAFGAQPHTEALAPDGAWTWFNDPRALYHNGSLYFGYNRSDGKSALSVFQPGRGSTSLWTSSWSERDDHDNPGLLALENGRLLAVYSRHGTTETFSYRLSLSTNPVSTADWSSEVTVNVGARVTYSNPFRLSTEPGTIYNFLRALNFNPTVIISTNNANSWQEPKLLIKSGSNSTVRPYVKYSSDGSKRIDFLYTDGHPNQKANSIYHMFYEGRRLYRTDGSVLKPFSEIPLLHDAGERGSVIYQYGERPTDDPNDHIPFGRAWCWDITTSTNEQPVCVFSVCRRTPGTDWVDDRIFYYYARWTGSHWQKRVIAQAGRPLYSSERDYAGGICLDPENPGVVYLSSNAANPFKVKEMRPIPLNKQEHYEIFQGITTDSGLTFSWKPITVNSTDDNLRPYVPRNHHKAASVLWIHGDYSGYTTSCCAIVGLFPLGF